MANDKVHNETALEGLVGGLTAGDDTFQKKIEEEADTNYKKAKQQKNKPVVQQ